MPPAAPMTKSMTPAVWGLMAVLALLWGTSFLSIRFALAGIGPLSIVAVRVTGAAAVIWLVVLLTRRPVPRDPMLIPHFLISGGLNCALPFSLISWGQQYIPSGLTGILNAGAAVFGVAVAALILRDERLTPRKAIGVTVGFLGVIAAIGPAALAGLDLTSLGQFAIIASSVCYAFGSVYTRINVGKLVPDVAAAGMLTGAAAWQIPIALLTEGVPQSAALGQVGPALLWLTLGCTASAYLLYFRILARAGAGNTSLVTLIIPPIAILAGALTLGERLTVAELLGFVVIAAGLVILNGGPKPRDALPATR